MGWVSFFDERELAAASGCPRTWRSWPTCAWATSPSSRPRRSWRCRGWARQRPLAWAVHDGRWGRRGLPGAAAGQPAGRHRGRHRGRWTPRRSPRPGSGRSADQAAGRSACWRTCRCSWPAMAGECPPPLPEPAAVAVFAADHGVHAQGVTPWPQEVTAQMVANFLASGAVVNAIAAQAGAEVCVVDVGVAADLPPAPGLLPRKVRPGTADMTAGPAMSRDEAQRAIEVGHRDRPRPGRRGQPLPADRGHGHRQHDRVGRADRRVHRRRPGSRSPGGAPASTTRPGSARSTWCRRALARHAAGPGRPAGRAGRGRRPGARRAGRLPARRRGAAGARCCWTA